MSCPRAFGHAPPLDAPADDVLAWLLGTGHLSLLDVEHRPLGERASPLYETAGVVEQVRTFGDARDATGLPCNVAALRQLTGTWTILLDAMRGLVADAPADHHRLLVRAETACALAPLSALRPDTPALLRPTAGLFKVCLGFREVFATALMEGRVDAEAPVLDESLLDFVDERAFLIGDAQVCAGSRVQIRQAFRALVSDAPAQREPSAPWLDPARDALFALQVLLACAAGAARALVRSPTAASKDAMCIAIYTAERTPRLVEVLRQIPDAGPLHPTLLYRAGEIDPRVRGFLEGLETARDAADVDAGLLAAASPVAERLLYALDRRPAPVTPHTIALILR